MSSHEHIVSIVILDIHSRYIKAGIVGKTLPEIELPINYDILDEQSTNEFPPQFEVDDSSLTIKQRQDLVNNLITNISGYKELANVYRKCRGNWFDFSSQEEQPTLIPLLHQTLYLIWNDHLQLTPRTCKVFLIDNEYSIKTKHQISKLLLEKLKVKSVSFIPGSILSILGSNRRDGLLLNFDWDGLWIHKIMDLRDIGSVCMKNLSGKTLHFEIVMKLIESDSDLNMEFDSIERYIFQSNETGLRDDVLKRLFYCNESLLGSIESIVKNSPIDIRSSLINNIVITGKLSSIPSFKREIINSLRKLFPTLHSFPTVGNWPACSLYLSQVYQKEEQDWKEITKDRLSDLYK